MSDYPVPFLVLEVDELDESPQVQHGELRLGDLCPQCGEHYLDYDGLLNLACPQCGAQASGCFT